MPGGEADNPARGIAEVAQFLAKNWPGRHLEVSPWGPKLGDIIDFVVPQTTTDVMLSATPMGLMRVANPKAVARSIVGTGRGLDQHTVMKLFDKAIRGNPKAIRQRSTGQVWGPSKGRNPDYHETLIEEMGDQGLTGQYIGDMMDDLEHGYIYGQEYISKDDLDTALMDVLSRMFSK